MIEIFEKAALAAGHAILEVYESDLSVIVKADPAPVTKADEQAEAIILDMLEKAYPDIPVVAEEAVAGGKIPGTNGCRFILVDPLDGTKEFINKRPDFTVNIALVDNGVPILGIVYAPARGEAWVGSDNGAEKLTVTDFAITARRPIATRPLPASPVAVASRSHNNAETEQFLKDNGVTDSKSIGSSLKFCLVAEGEADVYPRYGRTMEWDTAAGDAVLRTAGGRTIGLDGKPLPYGKRSQANDGDFANPFFIAWGR